MQLTSCGKEIVVGNHVVSARECSSKLTRQSLYVALIGHCGKVAIGLLVIRIRYLHLSELQGQPAGTGRRRKDPDPVLRKADPDRKLPMRISRMTEGIGTTVLVGGVSESTYIRNALADNPDIVFGEAGMGRDNAVGIARLGNRVLWQDDPSVSIN